MEKILTLNLSITSLGSASLIDLFTMVGEVFKFEHLSFLVFLGVTGFEAASNCSNSVLRSPASRTERKNYQ